MADNNQNWNGSSRQDRNRYHNQQNDENWNREERGGYNNVARDNGYRQNADRYDDGSNRNNSQKSQDYGWQDYGRANYLPDNDDNRHYSNQDYKNEQFGTWHSRDHGHNQQGGQYSQRNNYQNNSYDDQAGSNRNRDDWGRARVRTSNYDNGFFEDDQRRDQDQYRGRGQQYNNRDYRYQRSRNDRDRDWWDRTRDEVSSWFGDDDAERRRKIDQMSEGGHRGKGPKDYRRSEDRIREDVCDRLTDDDYLDASNIQIQIQGEEVILTGTVPSREQKRRAEDIVESVSGIRNVENRIKVNYNNTSDMIRENGRSAGSAEIGQ